MASNEHNRFRGKSATLGVVDVMDVSPTMVSATRQQVVATNWALEGIRGIDANPEYLKFTKFMKTNPPTFQGDFNPNETEGLIEALEGTFSMLACTRL